MARYDFLSGTDTAVLYALKGRRKAATGGEVHATIETRCTTHFTKTSIHKALERLHARGFVYVEEGPKVYGDGSTRNVRAYTMTPTGQSALAAARRLHEEMGAPLVH